MKPQNEKARPTTKQNGPEKTDSLSLATASGAVNFEQGEMIILLREILEVLIAIHNLQNEALHALKGRPAHD